LLDTGWSAGGGGRATWSVQNVCYRGRSQPTRAWKEAAGLKKAEEPTVTGDRDGKGAIEWSTRIGGAKKKKKKNGTRFPKREKKEKGIGGFRNWDKRVGVSCEEKKKGKTGVRTREKVGGKNLPRKKGSLHGKEVFLLRRERKKMSRGGGRAAVFSLCPHKEKERKKKISPLLKNSGGKKRDRCTRKKKNLRPFRLRLPRGGRGFFWRRNTGWQETLALREKKEARPKL